MLFYYEFFFLKTHFLVYFSIVFLLLHFLSNNLHEGMRNYGFINIFWSPLLVVLHLAQKKKKRAS